LFRLNIGLFHKAMPPRMLQFSIWVRFAKNHFISGTSATRNVHFPAEKRYFPVWIAISIWVRFANLPQRQQNPLR